MGRGLLAAGGGVALLQFDDGDVFGVLLDNKLPHLVQQLLVVPGITGGQGQVKQYVGMGIPGDDVQSCREMRASSCRTYSASRARSAPTCASEVTMGS